MTIYTIADILTGVFESIVTFMLFGAFMKKRDTFRDWVYVLGAIALAVCINLSNVLFNFGILNLFFIVFLTVLASFLYEANLKTQIIVSVLAVFLSAGIEILVLYIITSFGNFTTDEVVNNPKLRLLGIILSKTLYFTAGKIISLKCRKNSYRITTGYWVMFFSMLVSIGLAMELIFLFQYYNSIEYMDILAVITILGLMYSFMLVLYLYERLTAQTDKIVEQTVIAEQLQSQKKHFEELIISQNKLKRVRHDLKNHLLSLRGFFANGDNNGGILYIDKLQEYSDIDTDVIDSGNIVIDTLLSTKRELARSKNIGFTYQAIIPEMLNINAVDMCVLLGNILDNAIEACDRCKKDKQIDVSLMYKEGMFICKVENTAPNENNPLLKTTKQDKELHGIGLTSVKSVLDRYESTLNIERTDNTFIISFAIFI